jgi:hypothetical protein
MNEDPSTLKPTFDAAREPIDFIPLRPWEVRRVRETLAKLQGDPPAPTSEARTVIANLIEAHRAALAEYEATPWLARFRRGSKRMETIRTYRSRVVERSRVRR